ncbi:MAG TPA: PQQ-binding-like beta-propeller repeat protein [Verrucomicrobiae bacterium]|nr:PQQ-binding-like beta-propeller repeat protein [Verrucomicrobiae bacterium]
MRTILYSLVCLGLLLPSAAAGNWPRFRGTTGQGTSTEKGLPISWSVESNIVWKVAIPGEGWSSPIVWSNHVFVTTATENGTKCHVMALERTSGRILWDRVVLEQVPLRKEGKNSYATPTPCADGDRVYAVFGDGSVVALGFAGNVLWTNREVQHYSRHGLGASPILHDRLLIMAYDGSNRVLKAGDWPNNTDDERLGWQIPWDKAQVVALDVRTGKRVWTGRRGKSRIAHVTPNILQESGQTQLISCAGDAIQGFNPRTGELIWTVYSQGEGVTPGFATGDGLIFTSSGFEKTTLRTVKTGGHGEVTATHIAWEQRKGAPTQPSLLYVRPYLYTIADKGVAYCFKADNGEMVYEERVGGNFCASPVYADGNVYVLSEEGVTTVFEAGPKFRIVSKNPLNEKCQASTAVSQGNLFIRTEKNLYCVGM